jgi:hypothetical protein
MHRMLTPAMISTGYIYFSPMILKATMSDEQVQGQGSPKDEGGAHSGSVRQIAAAHEQRGHSPNGNGPTEGSHHNTARL